jgi:hypothetical protein
VRAPRAACRIMRPLTSGAGCYRIVLTARCAATGNRQCRASLGNCAYAWDFAWRAPRPSRWKSPISSETMISELRTASWTCARRRAVIEIRSSPFSIVVLLSVFIFSPVVQSSNESTKSLGTERPRTFFTRASLLTAGFYVAAARRRRGYLRRELRKSNPKAVHPRERQALPGFHSRCGTRESRPA